MTQTRHLLRRVSKAGLHPVPARVHGKDDPITRGDGHKAPLSSERNTRREQGPRGGIPPPLAPHGQRGVTPKDRGQGLPRHGRPGGGVPAAAHGLRHPELHLAAHAPLDLRGQRGAELAADVRVDRDGPASSRGRLHLSPKI